MALPDITADAVALQERDEFRAAGWLKVIAPAKVNLHLAVGRKRPDGYHDAATVMHAVNLHDVVYLRRALPGAGEGAGADDGADDGAAAIFPAVRMVSMGDVEAPEIDARDNLAAKAVVKLAGALQRPASDCALEIRIEKNIPAQAGLGGGSADAAAALVGAARLWGVAPDDPAIEDTARSLGADVAFFLHGGCAYFEGVGSEYVHGLEPSKRAVALVKPEGGVPTAEAYRRFDEAPVLVPDDVAWRARGARRADEVAPFNNLAAASEAIMPALAEVRSWLLVQAGVEGALLCGSGAATFALCGDFSAACAVVAAARKRGWWARASSLGSARALAVSADGAVAGGAR